MKLIISQKVKAESYKVKSKNFTNFLTLQTLITLITLQTHEFSGQALNSFSQGSVEPKRTISIHFNDSINIQGKAFLLQNRISTTMIDSTTIIDNCVLFSFPDSIQPGLYNAIFYTNIQRQPLILPVILSRTEKKISIATLFSNPFKETKILHSPDNERYYTFLKKDNILHQQQTYLSNLMSLYSENNPFYVSLSKEMLRIKQTKDSLYDFYLKQQFFDPVNLLIRRQIEIAKKKFTAINTVAEILLLNSPVLMQWVWTYLSQYKKESLSKEEQAKNYMNGIDTLANMFNKTLDLRNDIFKELSKAYEQSGFDEVSIYIYDTYLLSNTCQADESIKIKVENLKNTRIGKPAPDFTLMNGKLSLYMLPSDYTLLLFWASWCPHCTSEIPRIKIVTDSLQKVLYKQGKTLTVVAISLDTDHSAWQKYVQDNNLLIWLNTSELKGWKGELPRLYNVYATPTMFLLDKEKRILSKPTTVEELRKVLKELKIK